MPIRHNQDERSHDDYLVGWLCALPCEMAAAICMLDEQHPQLPQPASDHNNYTFGRIGNHNVVIACLPSGVMGITSAARVAGAMRSTFRSLRFGLMVGIGGGAPSEEHDIRLGDVVVSRPQGAFGGVIQYDFGKTVQEGRFVQTGSLNRPPNILLNAMAKLQTSYQLTGSRMLELIQTSFARYPRREELSQYPGESADLLYHWTYDHPIPRDVTKVRGSFNWNAGLLTQSASCDGCDRNYIIHRSSRSTGQPNVHYGLVASGNQVIRDGTTRERLRKEKDVLCFEMEAAGIVDEFPCLVIRGICDYADSHKNKKWQDYAATTAAAYGSELLSFVPSPELYEDSGSKSFSFSNQQRITHVVYTSTNPIKMRASYDYPTMTYSLTLCIAILQSLAFGGMFSRRNNIESRHPQTCTWILEHERFQAWFQQKHGLLWVKGIPGAGKSTVMAFLYDHFRRHTQHDTIRLDFFFNARGVPLQKQFLGLLRSLIYQIFKLDDSIKPRVRRLFLEKVSESLGSIQDMVWHQRELESLFSEVLEISAQAKDILVFVDALDEAGTAFARDIALYFHRLNEGIASQAGSARFCISSRHYPIVITIPGTEITVENYNRADIERYIFENLHLGYLLGPAVNLDDVRIWRKLQLDLVHKASGSFQWARLMVPIVEKHITDGSSPLETYDILQKVPNALHEAYSHILEHIINPEDRSRSLLLFQWVCLAQRPLSLTELRYAMAANTSPNDKTHDRVAELENLVKSDDQMERLIRALSGGLVETVKISGQSNVEPVHQSVNDFLLTGGLVMLFLAARQSPAQSVPDLIELSHSTLFQSCIMYLKVEGLDDIIEDAQKLNDIEKQLTEVSESLFNYQYRRERAYQSDGFTSDCTLRMIDGEESMIEAEDPLSKDSESAYLDNCELWIHLTETGNHILEQWHNLPRFSMTPPWTPNISPSFTFDNELARNFKRGGTALASNLIDTHAPFLWYALSNLLVHAEKLQAGYFMTDANQVANFESIIGIWRIGQKMLGNLRSDHIHPNSGTTLLHIGAAANVVSLVQYCLTKSKGNDVNVVDAGGNTPLHLAISGGHQETLEVLLRAQPNILVRNKENHTPLATAFRFSRISAAASIIRSCAGIAKYTSEFERIMGIAALKGAESLVKLLIYTGVDVNATGMCALYKAAKYGHLRTVQYLLEAGADINAGPSLSNGGPLQAASLQGHEKVVACLLERKNDIKEGELRAGLMRAKFRGHARLIEIFRLAGIE